MFAKPQDLFAKALNMDYAIGAFNFSNLEFAQAIVWAAEEQKSPVIISTSEGAIKYGGLNQLAALARTLAADAAVPVVLHLDHGHSANIVRECIEAGYTSVMIDASAKNLAENIQLTREVADYAHARNVWVEAELGAILGAEGFLASHGDMTPENTLTKSKDVVRFIKETNVDALAVSVGTIHGAFTGQEYIRFALLKEIEAAAPSIPLVLHGASGVAGKQLREAASTNVCKVNVDTELRIAFVAAVREYFKHSSEKIDPRDMLGPARAAVQQVVEEKIKLFGANGQA